jgi:hypothetical protein
MTARFLVEIVCTLQIADDCLRTSRQSDGTARDLRTTLAEQGWETQRGNHGRDVCPNCRIEEIRDAARPKPEPEP